MAYAFTQDVPIDAAFYGRITDRLGPVAPAGLVLHLAVESPEGGLRYIDLWESKADCERFVEQQLHPVVRALLAEVFGDDVPDEPARTELPVVHVWGSALAPSGS